VGFIVSLSVLLNKTGVFFGWVQLHQHW